MVDSIYLLERTWIPGIKATKVYIASLLLSQLRVGEELTSRNQESRATC